KSTSLPISHPLYMNVPPKNGCEVFFSRDIYEKYSLAPTLSELWLLSKRPVEENVDVSTNSVEEEQTGSTQAAVSAEVEVKHTTDSVSFPEARISYPYFSRLNEREQKTYLYLLVKYTKKSASNLANTIIERDYFQYVKMKEIVNNEVVEFLKFAQNAARSCAQDYDTISEDAKLYTEQFLSSCIGHVKKYPEYYTLHEITSIMGGKFNTELTLKLEKSLLTLGKARLLKQVTPSQLQLPVDYKTVVNIRTPEQKASALHSDISSDPNAEKLALKYCPQIALTSHSLFTLLNNHGLHYKEQWELPVSVKMIPVAGSKPVKVVYVDPPLPKKEITVREKNQIFHAIPADFLVSKQQSIPVSAVLMDKPVQKTVPPDTCPSRRIQTSDYMDVDFDNDVTELETFGTTSKPLTTSRTASAKPANTVKKKSDKLNIERDQLSIIDSGVEEQRYQVCEERFSAPDNNYDLNTTRPSSVSGDIVGVLSSKETPDNVIKLSSLGKNDSLKRDTDAAEAAETPISYCASDTDDERLIIDTELGGYSKPSSFSSNQNPVADTPRSPSPIHTPSTDLACSLQSPEQKKNVSRKPLKRLSKEFDPVGQILKMQTELLKPPSPKVHEQPQANVEKSSNPPASQVNPFRHLILTPWPTVDDHFLFFAFFFFFKGMLPIELQMLVEDQSEYTEPQEGNLVYKLFSLDDMLLLVRCSIQKIETRPRSAKLRKLRKQFPSYLLPKLSYQSYYGVEALTESEICQLWTESLLHSNCMFYVGHIDAFTSKLLMNEEITAQQLEEKFGTFNLQEGSYLFTHAAGDSSVTVYKSSLEKATRAVYNLHKAHSSLPTVPATLSVPWVPLDPNLPLPYHFNHGRVPCTFPPRPQAHMDTPSHGQQVSMETKSKPLPTKPFKKEGVAAKKKKKKTGQAKKMKK
uniref:Interactor of little elongation complex ELL subunit 2 n=1 Tax=Sphenodon punctatus TaxID=8508 RepID=A0A8D0GYG1_SPHPU